MNIVSSTEISLHSRMLCHTARVGLLLSTYREPEIVLQSYNPHLRLSWEVPLRTLPLALIADASGIVWALNRDGVFTVEELWRRA